MSGDWGSEAGSAFKLEGGQYGQICIDGPSRRQGCAMVFRNHRGTKADENEFTWIDATGFFPFAQAN
jgi:hypothetical protein